MVTTVCVSRLVAECVPRCSESVALSAVKNSALVFVIQASRNQMVVRQNQFGLITQPATLLMIPSAIPKDTDALCAGPQARSGRGVSP